VTSGTLDLRSGPRDPSPFRSILVPLDGSPLAEQALPLASHIAQRAGGKLRLVLAHQLPSAPVDSLAAKLFTSIELATRKSERGYLRGIQAKLREGGTRLSSAVTLTVKAGPELAQYVGELGIDLVVMATHGRGGIQRAWLGSVADHLIRTLEVPVLLVRPREGEPAPGRPPGVGQILVPLDGSPLAEEVLDVAAALARIWDVEVTLLQVVRPVLLSADPALPLPSAYDEGLTASCRQQAQDYLDNVVEQMHGQGLRATGVAVVGWNAADAILDVARPERVAVVALATHGRGGLRRLVLGSVADKLVRGADVPVLVYRPTARRKSKRRSANRGEGRGRVAARGAR
jgi:nucleotide-binding universal stress UspA family protein